MAEATTDIQNTNRSADGAESGATELEQSVDRLVREIDEAVENLEKRFSEDASDEDASPTPGPCPIDGAALAPEDIGGDNPEQPEPAATAPDEPDAPPVDDPADAPADAESAVELPKADEPPAINNEAEATEPAGENEDLTHEVDRLIAEAQSSIDEPTADDSPAPRAKADAGSEAATEAPAETNIDDLDARLAAEADDAQDEDLEGDFAAPAAADDGVESVADEVQKAVDQVAAGAPIGESTAAPNASDNGAADDADSGVIVRMKRALAPAEKPARLAVHTADAAARVVSAPLMRFSPTVRDTIGWIGVNSLFLALCVWVYVLLR